MKAEITHRIHFWSKLWKLEENGEKKSRLLGSKVIPWLKLKPIFFFFKEVLEMLINDLVCTLTLNTGFGILNISHRLMDTFLPPV